MSVPSPIVITGLGIVSPIGIGRDACWTSLREGRSGIGPITIFDPSRRHSKLAAEVKSFQPETILGPKGLRLLDRTTRLALCAAHEALHQSGLDRDEARRRDAGVVLGSAMGGVASLAEFTTITFRSGPRATNPALFPNAVANGPASQISIRFGIMGLNSTTSTGFASSLDALDTAALYIAQGHAGAILAGGVEEICEWTHTALDEGGLLARATERDQEDCRPLGARRNGTVLGEGAAIIVLESLDHARARGAPILAEYAGGATVTDILADGRFATPALGLTRAVELALQRTGTPSGEIGWVALGANGNPEGDPAEIGALRTALSHAGPKPVVTALKSLMGETLSASGAMRVAAAVLGLEHRMIPPTRILDVDPHCDADVVRGSARECDAPAVLVTCPTPLFHQSACVLRRFESSRKT